MTRALLLILLLSAFHVPVVSANNPLQQPIHHTITPAMYCADVAAYYGISLNELYRANPQLRWRCVVQTGDILTIPALELRSRNHYVDQYPCKARYTKTCLTVDDDATNALTHVLWGEASVLGIEGMTHVLQVVLNRANLILANRGMTADVLTREQYEQLLWYVMTRPYRASDGTVLPAFSPVAYAVQRPTRTMPEYRTWQAVAQIAADTLATNGQAPLKSRLPAGVLYFCSQPQAAQRAIWTDRSAGGVIYYTQNNVCVA